MRLLFDQNLSPELVARLADIFPASTHTAECGLGQSDDSIIWNYAAAHALTIVSKDADFHARSMLIGPPPKLVWLRVGNCSTSVIENLLRVNSVLIHTFIQSPTEAFIVLR